MPRGTTFANEYEAAAHNVSRMNEHEARRELYWLEDQEAQPPLRVEMIRLLRERVSNTDMSRDEAR